VWNEADEGLYCSRFLEDAYRGGAQGHFDAMAVHTDTACLDRPPGYYYREPDGR
jgi:hypothetical protein